MLCEKAFCTVSGTLITCGSSAGHPLSQERKKMKSDEQVVAGRQEHGKVLRLEDAEDCGSWKVVVNSQHILNPGF